MDTNALHNCFEGTLQADANVRMQAELQLKEAEKQPGFINSCLDIVIEPRVSDQVKSAAAVYLKNRIAKGWCPMSTTDDEIDNDEMPVFRDRIVPALVQSSSPSRQVLLKILNIIVNRDFPAKWPNLLDVTLSLFQTNNIHSVRVGLSCLLEVCKYFRWSTNEDKDNLDRIIDSSFPGVLEIGNSLLNETSLAAGEMLRDVLKIYKFATYQTLPVALQQEKNLADWGNLMLSVIRKDLPEDVMKLSEEDRDQNAWVKCKKWAYANLYRLFYRYAVPRKTRTTTNYDQFGQVFIAKFLPEILKAYFEQVDHWVQKKVWLSDASLFNILAFLEECISHKDTWALLKPHTDTIVTHVVFPLLCTTDADLEIFETDPSEYIHKHIDIYDESSTPDVAATNFLVTLIRKRSNHTLHPLLTFVQGIVNQHIANVADLDLARQQEAALRIMGSISHMVLSKKSPIANDMEPFIAQYVFPDFTSPHGFLRARACEFLNRYADVEFKNAENISIAYTSIFNCLDDENLPVQIEAVLALQPMVHHDGIRASLSERIPEVMTRLLDMANKVDNDTISGVISEFVEVFSEQLTPFAVDLAQRMSEQIFRLLKELVEQQGLDFSSGNYENYANEDKTMTALGLLSTMSTLLLALDNVSSVVLQIETILEPIISFILKNSLSDFFAEAFGLIENCTYCLKSVSPTMWKLLGEIHAVYKDEALDYISEMYPSLDNYLQYGTSEISASQPLQAIFFDIFTTTISTSARLGTDERIIACNIAQKMLLSLNGKIDNFVPEFLESASTLLSSEDDKLKNQSYVVNLLEVILASLVYNAQATVRFLESKNATESFFQLWFQKMESFTRVYDLKLVILSMLALFQVPDNELPASLQGNLGQISKGMVSVIKKYPEAVKNREELDKEYDSNIYSGDDGDLYEDKWNELEDEDVEEEVSTQEYLDYIETAGASDKFSAFDFGDDELDEEPLSESVLDKIDPNLMIKDTFSALKNSNPDRYHILTKDYTPEEVQILEASISAI